MKRSTLRRRLYSLLFEWFLVFVLVAAAVHVVAFLRFRRDAGQERLLLARAVAQSLDASLDTSFHHLASLAAQLPAVDARAVPRLRSHRFQFLFRDGVYLLDEGGRTLAADPRGAAGLPRVWLAERERVTPLVVLGGKERLAIVQPFRRDGRQLYLVGAMDPRTSAVSDYLRSLAAEPVVRVAVVDDAGLVIAASGRDLLLRRLTHPPPMARAMRERESWVGEVRACALCPEAGDGPVLEALVPLRLAPWAVLVEEPAETAFAAAYALQGSLAIGALLLASTGLVLLRGLSRSVISPIQQLSRQAEGLRRGDLATPIRATGDHELALLASTLEGARRQLASTLAEVRSVNQGLEAQVASRTRALQAQYEDLELLHRLAAVAAEEREVEPLAMRSLELLVAGVGLERAVLVVRPPVGDPRTFVHPPGTVPPQTESDEQGGDGWQRLPLPHAGRVQGLLLARPAGDGEAWFPDALADQLAMAIQGALLLEQAREQDVQRRALVRRLLAAGEEERRRIARELHDETSQLLTAVQLSLDRAGSDRSALARAGELLTRTQLEIRRLIHDLRPSLLDDMGLAAAVEWYAENSLQAAGIEVRLEVERDLVLPADVEITVFRIYQEIVTNVLRHAAAEHVGVELYRADRRLVLTVEDDGVGFDPAERSQGVGLVGMRERAELVGGSLELDSEPGMGSQVRLEIPLAAEEERAS
jgi:signal transduction histidine kinase